MCDCAGNVTEVLYVCFVHDHISIRLRTMSVPCPLHHDVLVGRGTLRICTPYLSITSATRRSCCCLRCLLYCCSASTHLHNTGIRKNLLAAEAATKTIATSTLRSLKDASSYHVPFSALPLRCRKTMDSKCSKIELGYVFQNYL